MMKAKKGIVKATIISAEPLKKKSLETISAAIVDLAGVNKTVCYTVSNCIIPYFIPPQTVLSRLLYRIILYTVSSRIIPYCIPPQTVFSRLLYRIKLYWAVFHYISVIALIVFYFKPYFSLFIYQSIHSYTVSSCLYYLRLHLFNVISTPIIIIIMMMFVKI